MIPSVLLVLKTIKASEVANLDSNVLTGGGTDDTDALQRVLDQAPDLDGLVLIMDGAALVRGLRVHSNTTILCLGASCGFFLADGANRPVLEGAKRSARRVMSTATSPYSAAPTIIIVNIRSMMLPDRPRNGRVCTAAYANRTSPSR